MKTRRLALLLGLALSAGTVALVAACTTEDGDVATDGGAEGGGDPKKDASIGETTEDGAVPPPKDAGTDARDAAAKKDANGPGVRDASCGFNADCQSALRCSCTEAAGCSCQPGARGTGQNGLDVCDAGAMGNDCESALCVEGPGGGSYYCSDQCQTAADCTGKLPVCADISFVGRVCIRQP